MTTPSDETKAHPSAEDLLKQSLLYRESQAEHEEILKHKWYESEKKGYDIGFQQAKVDWMLKYGSRWHKERLKKSRSDRG